jgi:hypothetical protein
MMLMLGMAVADAVSIVKVVTKLPTATTMIDTLGCAPAEQTIGVSSWFGLYRHSF